MAATLSGTCRRAQRELAGVPKRRKDAHAEFRVVVAPVNVVAADDGGGTPVAPFRFSSGMEAPERIGGR